MAKTDFTTGTDGQSVHGRTTAGSDKSQAVVLAIDASDSPIPADPTTGLAVRVTNNADPSTGSKQDAAKTSIDKVSAGATPHPSAAGTGDVALTSVAGRLMSFSCAETTGSAGAKFYLRDGTDSTGTMVAVVTLAAGESVRDSFGPNGISLLTGLWLDRVSGSTEVTAAVA